eukprot:gene28309-34181_t
MIPALPLRKSGPGGKLFTPNVLKAHQNVSLPVKNDEAKAADTVQVLTQSAVAAEIPFPQAPTSVNLLDETSSKPSHSSSKPPSAPKVTVAKAIVRTTPASASISAPAADPVTDKRKADEEARKEAESEAFAKRLRKPPATLRKAVTPPTQAQASSSSTSNSKNNANAINLAARHTMPPKPSKKTAGAPVATIFPLMYGDVAEFDRVTFYAKKTPQGIDGVIFANLDERAVICHLNPLDALLSRQLHVGDVVLSVNAIDARYAKFKAIVQLIMTPGVATPTGPAQLLDNSPVVLLRNKTNDDKMICIVFARPRNMAEILPRIEDRLVDGTAQIPVETLENHQLGLDATQQGDDREENNEFNENARSSLQSHPASKTKTSQKTKKAATKKSMSRTAQSREMDVEDDDEEL